MQHRRSPYVVSLFLSLSITTFYVNPLVCAQPLGNCSTDENGIVINATLRKYCEGTRYAHVFWASSLSPIATNLSPDAQQDVNFFMSHMEHIGTLAREKRAADFLLPYCELPQPGSVPEMQRRWLKSSDIYVNTLGVPTVKSHCFTSVSSSSSNVTQLIPHLRTLNRLVNDSGRQLANRARTIPQKSYVDRVINSWDAVVGYFQGTVDDSVYKCSVWNVVGFRTRGKWGIAVKLTNDYLNESLPMGQRIYLSEILTSAPGRGVHSVLGSVYKEGKTDAPLSNTTTSIARWGGRPEVTEFFRIPVEQVPAVSRLLELSKKDMDLLQDTVFGSNIAILVLPIFMTLVPISSIDYVETSVVLLYALMTDIVSTLPLFVKAIELLSFPDQTGCESWVHGIEANGKDSTVVIETWCASCRPQTSFRVYGYVFLAFSIFFMIVGLGAEIYARQRLVNSLKKTDTLPRRFWSWREREAGYPSMHSYAPSCASSAKCQECTCVQEPSFSMSDVPSLRVENIEDIAGTNSFLPLGSRRLNFFGKADT